jgi:hypothetical protein
MTACSGSALKGSTSGLQFAGWKPHAFALQDLGDRVLVGQRIPVFGGVTLNAGVYISRPSWLPSVPSSTEPAGLFSPTDG